MKDLRLKHLFYTQTSVFENLNLLFFVEKQNRPYVEPNFKVGHWKIQQAWYSPLFSFKPNLNTFKVKR